MILTASVPAVKEAMELQVEACMKEEDEVAAESSSDTSVGTITYRHLQPGQGHPEGEDGLSGR